MLEQDLSLSKFPWQVIWEHIYFNFELLGNGILQILIKLSITMEETKLVGALVLLVACRCTL